MVIKKAGHISFRGRSILGPLLVLATVFLVYLNSLNNSFHFDDFHSIVENPYIRDMGNIPDFLSSPEMFSGNPSMKMYRPLLLVTYALNYRFGEYDVFGYHVVNVLIHVFNTLFVYLIVLYLIKTVDAVWPAFIASLLFGVHTINTHPVNYISSRSVLLVSFFYLGAFYFYIRLGDRSHKSEEKVDNPQFTIHYLLSLFFYVCALLSKEIAITLPLILLLYDFTLSDRSETNTIHNLRFTINRIIRYIPFWLISWGYLIVRERLFTQAVMKVSKTVLIGGGGNKGQWSIYLNVLTQFKALLFYLRTFLFPVGLSVEHDVAKAVGFWDASSLGPFLVVLAVLVVGLYMWRKGKYVSFGIFWFFITLLPETIIPLNLIVNEHRSYLPGVGFAIMLGFGFQGLRLKLKGKRSMAVLAGAIVLFISLNAYGTIKRNQIWKDGITLWKDTIKKYPGLYRAHNNLGKTYADKGLLDMAIVEYKTTLKLNPSFTETHFNLGLSYDKKGLYKEAMVEYQTFLKSNPDNMDAHNNLGNLYVKLGSLDRAIKEYKEALRIEPGKAQIHYALGVAYDDKGLFDDSIEEYKEALRLDPDYADAHYDIAVVYHRNGLIDLAERHYKEALRISPNDTDAQHNLELIYKDRQFK